jgi:hypothetical protein
MGIVARVAHDGDDLVDNGRVGRVADALVAGWAPGVVAGRVAGERRRPAASKTDKTVTWISSETNSRYAAVPG